MYQIRLPSPALRPFIECYWFVHATVSPQNRLEELIFTDARADIVFTYGDPYHRIRADRSASSDCMRSSNVDGQRRYPVRILQNGKLNLVGVRFRPGGLAPFVRMPVHELAGHTVSLGDVFGASGTDLEQQLFDTTGKPNVQASLLDRFFRSRLTLPAGYHKVLSWVKTIEQHAGLIAIHELSQTADLSIRSIDRLFQRIIGLPPKFFARTVRLQHVHFHLMQHPDVGWEDIVAAYGYYDQSHFAKDLKALTGADWKSYHAYLVRERTSPPPNHVQFLQDGRVTAGL